MRIHQIGATGYSDYEKVAIAITSSDGSSLVGAKITVTYGDRIISDTWRGSAIVINIPDGEIYTISFGSMGVDVPPQNVTFTAVAGNEREVVVQYTIAANGVYIYATDGSLVQRSNWASSGKVAVGVALISDNCRFVVAPDQSDISQWGGSGTLISGITTTSSQAAAILDFAGKENTDKIISQLGNGNAPAIEYCRNYQFKNGKAGYMGSAGEWNELYKNKSEVNLCMSAIGGVAINAASGKYHYTSTQVSTTTVWGMQWYNNAWYTIYKSESVVVPCRPFAEL